MNIHNIGKQFKLSTVGSYFYRRRRCIN